MPSSRLQPLNIFLLRDGTSASDALRSGRHVHQSIRLGDTDADLYMKRSPADPPDWVTFLGATVPATWQFRSVSAVLFVPAAGRTFAIPFGAGGRFMLEPDAYEEGFGLKVALNSVNPDMVRGLGVATLGGYGVRSDRQASRDAPLSAFETDEFRDLVGFLAGTPGGIPNVASIRGRDSAGVSARIVKHGIPQLASDLLDLHSSTAYLQHYEFFDNIARVSRTESDDLFADLYRRLYSGQTNGVGLVPPEVFNDEDTVGYALGTQPPDPAAFIGASPQVLSQELGSKPTFAAAVGRAERLRLWAIPAGGGEIPNWPVRRCLTFEDPGPSGPRVLFNGSWWAAARAFADRINRFTDSLPRATLPLPIWDKNTHATELLYNTKAAADNGWALMDQKTVQAVGRSRIEVCDLLTPQQDLVHVKSYGGSSVLSHLFAQGTTSAEVIREEPTARTQARTHLGPTYEHLIPDATAGLDPSDFRVVYAIAAVGSGPVDEVLPFFSRVHLRKHAIMLDRLGFGWPELQRFELLPKV